MAAGVFTGDTDDARIADDFERSPRAIVKDMLAGGMSIPWTMMAMIGLA